MRLDEALKQSRHVEIAALQQKGFASGGGITEGVVESVWKGFAEGFADGFVKILFCFGNLNKYTLKKHVYIYIYLFFSSQYMYIYIYIIDHYVICSICI